MLPSALLLLLLPLSSLCSTLSPSISPPSPCTSLLTQSRLVYICQAQGLRSVPSLIPPHTQVLLLAFNGISSVSQFSFPDLPLLRSLSLGAQHLAGSLSVGQSAFLHSPNLTSLDLGGNLNLRLHPEAFGGLAQLEVLLLDSNGLDETVLESGLFRDLTNLRKLDLSFNRIRRLRPDPSFFPLTSLSYLILKLNKIDSVCGEDLRSLRNRKLELLDLSSNPLHFTDSPSCSNPFRDIALGTLDVSSMDWNAEKVETFFRTISGTKVERLKMNHAAALGSGFGFHNLRDPDEDTFSGLNSSEVWALDLSHGFISQLAPRVFSAFSRLISLDLSSNKINRIRPGAFSGLGELVSLNLSGNLLGELLSPSFQVLCPTSLQALDLSSNHIGAIQYGALDGLVALETLSLRDNALTRIPSVRLPGLTLVLLSQNRISDVYGLSSFSPRTTFLDLSGNRLTDLGSLWEILELRSLRYLLLGRNRLSRCSPSYASRQVPGKGLLYLDLSDNALGGVWKSGQCKDIFQGLGQLESLNLSRNHLSSLPEDLFQGLTGLQALDLSWNDLRGLRSGAFLGLSYLRSLNLQGNSLVTLSLSFLVPLTSLESIDLSEVTFVCDCGLRELWDWMGATNVTVQLGGRTASCMLPSPTLPEPLLVTYLQENC
ncbi:toll-like receptor 5 [Ascaphus truei]|uniref:toll-like receptor 5 n=1 Tax=Ascaphus truei TaxID=8439 RepID=UPI003F591146